MTAQGELPRISPRDVSFDPGDEPAGSWLRSNPYISHFYNALALTFPAGERFFMDSVQRVRSRIDDGELQQRISGFLSQEALHGREHQKFNAELRAQGYPADLLDANTRVGLWWTRASPALWQLALTVAFEHYTAVFADRVLEDPEILEGSTEAYAEIWRWHCAEETEHKAVAFDVHARLSPGPIGYLRRVLAMSVVTATFIPYLTIHQLVLASVDHPVPNPTRFWQAVQYLWGKPGLMRTGVAQVLDFFRPRFHPWDRRNGELVGRWAREEEPYLPKRRGS